VRVSSGALKKGGETKNACGIESVRKKPQECAKKVSYKAALVQGRRGERKI